MENQTHSPAPNTHTVRIAITVVLVILIGVVGVFVLSNKTQQKNTSYSQTVPSPTLPTVIGRLTLTAPSVQMKAFQPSQVVLKADSQGKDITGFDILITYDPTAMTVNQVNSLSKDFQINSFTKRKGEISITGTKTAGAQTSQVLSSTDIVGISITPQKKGSSELSLKERISNERTKFIDSQYRQYTPILESLKVIIL